MNLNSFKEIFLLFLRLGTTGFGGPVALIAMMEEECSRRRHWISPEEFAETYAICKLLPGPVAVQMSIQMGYRRSGHRLGGLVGGFAFTIPSFVMVLFLSVFYVKWNLGARFQLLFQFMQASALALVALSTYQLGAHYLKKINGVLIFILSSSFLYFFPSYEPVVILSFGLIGVAWATEKKKNTLHSLPLIPFVLLGELFWTCFKAGEFVFGTGLAILPVMEGELVGHYHWLSHADFASGIAIGQITPGPVTISVVFFGYKIAGYLGSIVAALGIYLPALINILFILPLVWRRLKKSKVLGDFAAWAFPAVVGGIASSMGKLSLTVLTTPATWLIVALTFIAIKKYKLPGWGVILASGTIGFLAQGIHSFFA